MTAFVQFGTFIVLHGAFFLIVLLVILSLFESQRSRLEVLKMTVFAIAPFVVLSFTALGVMLASKMSLSHIALITSTSIKLALAFPVLWLYFKVNVKLALIYSAMLIVISQFSPFFVRAIRQLIEGKPAPMFFLAVVCAIPAILWIATRRIQNPQSRMLVRCVLIAALFAPTLVIGHGGAAILPAGLVWPVAFQGGMNTMIQLGSLSVSVVLTTVVLLFTYKAIANVQAANRTGRDDE